MPQPISLTICVDQIQFDPADDVTKGFNPATVVHYIYLNQDLLKVLKPQQEANPNVVAQISADQLANPTNVVRIISKDTALKQGSDFAQVGTISLNLEYFKNVPKEKYGQTFQQQITLFDDIEDDEFDGDLGEDDEELPMIRTRFTVNNQVQLNVPVVTQDKTASMVSKNSSGVAGAQSPRNRQGSGLADANARSLSPRVTKRKTVVTESGRKKVVTEKELKQMQEGQQLSSARQRVSARRQQKHSKVSDIFGDFFGFGANPPGCMAKNT